MVGGAAGAASAMLLSGSADVDFFIHSYYEFELFGQTLSINRHRLSDAFRSHSVCQT